MLKLEQILHWILILWYPEFGNFVITFIYIEFYMGPSWSYGSWISNYLCTNH